MHQKIISSSQLRAFAARLRSRNVNRRREGARIVFTNGVFDILHAGHVDYLTRAKKLGDFLIVGLNSDASVKMNKGDFRPIIPYKYRAELLAALEVVDYVVPLTRKTPDDLIKLINPDVLVKGSEYRERDIVGADFVRQHGGKVVRMKMVKGLSTSDIISRIVRNSKSAKS